MCMSLQIMEENWPIQFQLKVLPSLIIRNTHVRRTLNTSMTKEDRNFLTSFPLQSISLVM